MHPPRLVQHAIVLSYLAVTCAAMLFTLTRIELPFVPYPLLIYSYGMMAPYQSDSEWGQDVVAEGEAQDGSWERIDLDRYMPYGFAERIVRRHLYDFDFISPAYKQYRFTEYAVKILRLEQARGKPYRTVRLWVEAWPRSPEGFETYRYSPFLVRRYITEAR